jgi:hypothetical protein
VNRKVRVRASLEEVMVSAVSFRSCLLSVQKDRAEVRARRGEVEDDIEYRIENS